MTGHERAGFRQPDLSAVQEVATIERAAFQPEKLGLSLAEGKAILSGLQAVMVEQQPREAATGVRWCPTCGTVRASKGTLQLRWRTLFGTLTLASPRLHHYYGERYRNGEAISSAVAESTINQVVSRRMVKNQPMQWTPEGAHRLLQTRTRVVTDDVDTLVH